MVYELKNITDCGCYYRSGFKDNEPQHSILYCAPLIIYMTYLDRYAVYTISAYRIKRIFTHLNPFAYFLVFRVKSVTFTIKDTLIYIAREL